MRAYRSVILLSGLFFSAALCAAAEFEDGLVPIELAEEFTGGTIHRGLSENFPVAALPSQVDLSVIGSVTRGSLHQEVLLQSSVRPLQLREALQQAYAAEGWVDLSERTSNLSLCHDQLGRLTFRLAGEDMVRASWTTIPSSSAGGLTCAQQRAYQDTREENITFARSLMPILEVPEGTVASGPLGGFPYGVIRTSSFTSNAMNFEMNQEGNIEVPGTTVSDLFVHFARQLEEQGWMADSSAVGDSSSSSVWFKMAQTPETDETPPEDLHLIGIMTILDQGADVYRILFRLQSSGAAFHERGFSTIPPNSPELGIRGIPPDIL